MKRSLLMVMVALLSIAGSKAQTIDLMKPIATDSAVRTGTLPSGIKYYIRANGKDPKLADFYIVYNVGALQEEDRQNGLAHFLEHMAFNGSKNFPDNSMINYLQTIGVKFGENLNAGTEQQKTTYMITSVPITRPAIVDSVLLILHDWAGFISLNEDDIDKERGVIQEEFRLYEGQASFRASRKETAALFGDDNIYTRRDIIGPMENLKKFTYQDIRDFYHKWYRPDMQAFVVVGDFDVDEMEAKLKATMADIKPFEVQTPKEVVTVEPLTEPRIAVITDPEQTSTALSLIYRHRPIDNKYNNTAMKLKNDMVNNIATSMLDARLSNVAKESNAPFQGAACGVMDYYNPFDLFITQGSARQGEADRAFRAMYTEVLRAARSGFVLPEFDRSKANMLSSIEQTYNNRGDRRNGQFTKALLSNFISNTPYPSAETAYQLSKQILTDITLDEVNAQMASLVGKECVLTLVAQNKEGVAIPTQDELRAAMKEVEALDIAPYTEQVNTKPLVDGSKLLGSAVQKTESGKYGSTVWTLKNGIRVVVKPTEYKADEIMLRAFKKGGTSTLAATEDLRSIDMYSDFENLAGLSEFSDTELTRLLSGKSVGLSPVITDTRVGYSGSSSKKDFETMLQMNYLYATAPRFEASDWGVLMDKVKTQIKGAEKNPMRIFKDSVAVSLFGHNERRAPLSEKYLEKVSLERMKAVYKDFFASADGMTFVIIGSVNLDTIRPLVEKYIGSLPVLKSKKAPAVGPYIVTPAKGVVNNIFVTPQEAGRVTAMVVKTGTVNYSLAERLNLEVASSALQNEYTKIIREAKGGAYVVQNMIGVDDYPRPLFVNQTIFLTDSAKLDGVLPEVKLCVDTLITKGPSQKELGKAIEAMSKQFAEDNNSNSTWLSHLSRWYETGTDEYTNYLEELRRINVESVRQAAKRAFEQNNVMTIIQKP
ncbi:MAG: insulinase family protein [Mucinivorans sp.]